ERNLWIDMVIRMAEQAPVLIVSGNHGKESDGDLYALAKAKGKHSIYLSTEPELIEFDHVAVATFPTLARRIGLVHRRRRHARGLCRADGGVQSAIRTAARLLPLVLRALRGSRGKGVADNRWLAGVPSTRWRLSGASAHSTSG